MAALLQRAADAVVNCHRIAPMDLAATGEALVPRLMPDLKDVPIYVVLGSQAYSHGGSTAWRGCTGPKLSQGLRDVIGSRWRGAGVAMLVNDRLIVENSWGERCACADARAGRCRDRKVLGNEQVDSW
jgi:hypothetical protein